MVRDCKFKIFINSCIKLNKLKTELGLKQKFGKKHNKILSLFIMIP